MNDRTATAEVRASALIAPPAISVRGLAKRYEIYARPVDRLKQSLFRRFTGHDYFRAFWALDDISLDIRRGEALGLVGRNGAGKSTLLQLMCGTLYPTHGGVTVHGRISALLELGAGFNPDFSGRENVFLAASLLGLDRGEIDRRYAGIVEFAGVADFIEQPVKTYSSGMYVRLAFAVATSVDPDILVIDEALSVGDGQFARKSFDRIMALKEQGTTIVFCSHSLYQVETFCDRVLWLERGKVRMLGQPRDVIQAYSDSLIEAPPATPAPLAPAAPAEVEAGTRTPGFGRLTKIDIRVNGEETRRTEVDEGPVELELKVAFESDPNMPAPVVGVRIEYGSMLTITSDTTLSDRWPLTRDAAGRGEVTLSYPGLSLRSGEFLVSVYLGCENALHIYDKAERIASVTARTRRSEPGIVNLPHAWKPGR